jgi:hypothetical protein
MKKYVLGVILTAMVVVPFAAMADTGGSATATLDILSVINTIVTGDWGNLDLTQSVIGSYGFGGANFGNLMAWPDTVGVTVQALTNYNVYSSYSASLNGGAQSSALFTDPDNTLKLTGDYVGFLPYRHFASPTSHGLTDTVASGAADLVDLGFGTGLPNFPTGETETYGLAWDPAQLSGNHAVNDAIAFTVFFIVTDSDT